jgi:hypothetical protein
LPALPDARIGAPTTVAVVVALTTLSFAPPAETRNSLSRPDPSLAAMHVTFVGSPGTGEQPGPAWIGTASSTVNVAPVTVKRTSLLVGVPT